jgi:hypothetical protein
MAQRLKQTYIFINKNSTSFFSAKELDIKFSKEHSKIVNQLKKINNNMPLDFGKDLILPTISYTRMGVIK